MEPNSSNQESLQAFWKNHVLSAKDFKGTDREYCQRNDLSSSTLSNYKKLFGLTKGRKRNKSKFTQIQASVSIPSKPSTSFKNISRELPDPKWTAEFVMSLMGKSGK